MMRDDTRRRLDRLIWLRRLKIAGGGALIAALIAGGLWIEDKEAAVENKRVAGVVLDVAPFNVPTGNSKSDGVSIDVALDDGRHARVVALKTSNPKAGDHVEIVEHIHGSGRHTFTWK